MLPLLPEDMHVLRYGTCECCLIMSQGSLCRSDQNKDFEMERLYWIPWMDPKCNYIYPDKREAEGDLIEPMSRRRRCEDEQREREDADPEEERDVPANHQTLEDPRTDSPPRPPEGDGPADTLIWAWRN